MSVKTFKLFTLQPVHVWLDHVLMATFGFRAYGCPPLPYGLIVKVNGNGGGHIKSLSRFTWLEYQKTGVIR